MTTSPEIQTSFESGYNPNLPVTEQLFKIALIGCSLPTAEEQATAKITENELLNLEAEEYRR